jgi:hypothetical protein
MEKTMPALLTKDEASNLFAHLNHSSNPRKNMHTRDVVKPVKSPRKWDYLNGMKSTQGVIKGHIHYRNCDEISYQINKDGTYLITDTVKITASKAATQIKALKNNIMAVVSRGHGGIIRVKYTPNQYYLRRHNWGLTTTAKTAIKSGALSEGFLKKMARWELCLIQGREKSKPKK